MPVCDIINGDYRNKINLHCVSYKYCHCLTRLSGCDATAHLVLNELYEVFCPRQGWIEGYGLYRCGKSYKMKFFSVWLLFLLFDYGVASSPDDLWRCYAGEAYIFRPDGGDSFGIDRPSGSLYPHSGDWRLSHRAWKEEALPNYMHLPDFHPHMYGRKMEYSGSNRKSARGKFVTLCKEMVKML